MNDRGQVGPSARMLGFAGLLPQALAAAMVLSGRAGGDIGNGIVHGLGQVIAFGYAALILSFLGGMWWGFAMRRGAGQGRLAAIAVVPSLVAGAMMIALGRTGQFGWCLVALGSAIMLTLLVDRHLTTTGETPAGWMGLRIPLSVGLGSLTILAGAITGSPVTRF